MNKKILVFKIIASIIALIGVILLIFGIKTLSGEDFNQIGLILIMGVIALISFIPLLFLNKGMKRMLLLIPIFLYYFCIQTISVNYFWIIFALNSRVSDVVETSMFNSELFNLMIIALFIVAAIFALKKKRWATIAMFVLIGIYIMDTIMNIQLNYALFDEANASLYDAYLFILMANLCALISFAINFIQNQYISIENENADKIS